MCHSAISAEHRTENSTACNIYRTILICLPERPPCLSVFLVFLLFLFCLVPVLSLPPSLSLSLFLSFSFVRSHSRHDFFLFLSLSLSVSLSLSLSLSLSPYSRWSADFLVSLLIPGRPYSPEREREREQNPPKRGGKGQRQKKDGRRHMAFRGGSGGSGMSRVTVSAARVAGNVVCFTKMALQLLQAKGDRLPNTAIEKPRLL